MRDSRRESARRALSLLVCRCSFFEIFFRGRAKNVGCQQMPTLCPGRPLARWRRTTGFLPGRGSRRMGGDGIARRRSNGAASASNEPDRAASWDRVLYRKQAFPDNHTDDTFLSGLVLNGRITPRVLSEVMLDAATVSQQLAVVALKSTAVAHLLRSRDRARPGGHRRRAARHRGARRRGDARARARGSPVRARGPPCSPRSSRSRRSSRR